MKDPREDQIGPFGPDELQASLPDERVARNETTARRINESIEDGRLNRGGPIGFVCECGRVGCNALVELTPGEYEDVRSDPRRFVIVEGHEASFDALVARTDHYAVVQKQGAAGRIAEATDPRAEDV